MSRNYGKKKHISFKQFTKSIGVSPKQRVLIIRYINKGGELKYASTRIKKTHA
jgi:hypothetical protein